MQLQRCIYNTFKHRGTGCTSNSVEYQYSKGKNVNEMWQKLPSMSTNTRLDFKTRFVWEKRKLVSEICTLVQCSVNCRVTFLASDNFHGIFVEFCFMMFDLVLIKELARILIDVRKIFNWRVFFEILLSMCLKIVEKQLWTYEHSCYKVSFRMALSKKLQWQWWKPLSLKYLFLTLVLKQK